MRRIKSVSKATVFETRSLLNPLFLSVEMQFPVLSICLVSRLITKIPKRMTYKTGFETRF